MPFAVFCLLKNKVNDHNPHLDPMSFGRGKEPCRYQLLRRGRVAIFPSMEVAKEALQKTVKTAFSEGAEWRKFSWQILECEMIE